MPRLAKYLFAGKGLTIGNRRTTKRFWKIILLAVALIILTLLLDKLPKPESYFTSVYWRGVNDQ